MNKVFIRFYEELNDFLPDKQKKKRFAHEFSGSPSVKDLIESLGVPHVEIDLILVNGKPVDFNYHPCDNDDVSVYPVFESFDISSVQHLRAKPLRNKKFILDVHLGTLAKYLRMLGFDSLYQNNFIDDEIVNLSLKEERTILTRDRGLLKRNEVTHGYFVRNISTRKQVEEILTRFDLTNSIHEFSRCLECNSLLKQIEKDKVLHLLPPKVKVSQNEFYFCRSCGKAYWKGTHYLRMKEAIDKFISKR